MPISRGYYAPSPLEGAVLTSQHCCAPSPLKDSASPVQFEIVAVAALFADVLGGLDEHASGAGNGIVNAHLLGGFEELDHEADDVRRRVELTALLPALSAKNLLRYS